MSFQIMGEEKEEFCSLLWSMGPCRKSAHRLPSGGPTSAYLKLSLLNGMKASMPETPLQATGRSGWGVPRQKPVEREECGLARWSLRVWVGHERLDHGHLLGNPYIAG